ncbi:hypothetical protein HDV05_004410 [Chytridiales sp. JEL 0842]|nr:hypothetical protein HDV05_004410 [Chytridiales sp. JEL 0842]
MQPFGYPGVGGFGNQQPGSVAPLQQPMLNGGLGNNNTNTNTNTQPNQPTKLTNPNLANAKLEAAEDLKQNGKLDSKALKAVNDAETIPEVGTQLGANGGNKEKADAMKATHGDGSNAHELNNKLDNKFEKNQVNNNNHNEVKNQDRVEASNSQRVSAKR